MEDYNESEWSGSDAENDAGEEQALKDMQPLHTPRMLNPGYPDIHRDDHFYHDMDYQGEQDMLFETSQTKAALAAYLDIITGHVEQDLEPFMPVYDHGDDFDEHYDIVDHGDIGADYGPIDVEGDFDAGVASGYFHEAIQ